MCNGKRRAFFGLRLGKAANLRRRNVRIHSKSIYKKRCKPLKKFGRRG